MNLKSLAFSLLSVFAVSSAHADWDNLRLARAGENLSRAAERMSRNLDHDDNPNLKRWVNQIAFYSNQIANDARANLSERTVRGNFQQLTFNYNLVAERMDRGFQHGPRLRLRGDWEIVVNEYNDIASAIRSYDDDYNRRHPGHGGPGHGGPGHGYPGHGGPGHGGPGHGGHHH